jgi:hypothetical protein
MSPPLGNKKGEEVSRAREITRRRKTKAKR